MHDILMITYNRATYTKLALESLLNSCDSYMRVWVWHNGDDEETLKVVKSFQDHPNFHRLKHSSKNLRLNPPTNWFWEESDGEYLTKVDDDCLLPEGWGASLRELHEENPDLGIVGCWRFYDEDFYPKLASKKMIQLRCLNQLMSNPWVQGSGYVMKRKCLEDNGGKLGENESFPAFCIRAALKGWKNGWAYPFIHEEHMDDPRSPYCLLKSDEDFMAQRPLSAINDNVVTLSDWAKRVRFMAKIVQKASSDPKQHTGWRRRLHNVIRRTKIQLGVEETWRSQ